MGLSLKRYKESVIVPFKTEIDSEGNSIHTSFDLCHDGFKVLEKVRRGDRAIWNIAVENAKTL